MAAALSGGASWGMDDGPEDFDPNDVDSIDWKVCACLGGKALVERPWWEGLGGMAPVGMAAGKAGAAVRRSGPHSLAV